MERLGTSRTDRFEIWRASALATTWPYSSADGEKSEGPKT